jgi:glycogen debranching enzyme
VALVEVQAYVFAARRAMAVLARRRGEIEKANRWRRQAVTIRTEIERRFWMRERRYYGLAVDGAGELCQVRTSNAAHLLYVGLPSAERGQHVAAQLLSAAFNSGWGIRTVAVGEARYNPMSYHNGSIWPHDTALAAAGLARYGRRDGAVRLLSQMFEAAVQFDSRLPELFCGFERFAGEAPVSYPVACLPQAWAAGSLFMMLEACLGISIDGARREVHIDRPQLPVGIDHLRIERLAVGDASLTVEFHRVDGRVVAVVPGDQPDIGRTEVLMHL